MKNKIGIGLVAILVLGLVGAAIALSGPAPPSHPYISLAAGPRGEVKPIEFFAPGGIPRRVEERILRELPDGSEILLVKGIGDTYKALVRLQENKYADVTLNDNQVEVNELCNHEIEFFTPGTLPKVEEKILDQFPGNAEILLMGKSFEDYFSALIYSALVRAEKKKYVWVTLDATSLEVLETMDVSYMAVPRKDPVTQPELASPWRIEEGSVVWVGPGEPPEYVFFGEAIPNPTPEQLRELQGRIPCPWELERMGISARMTAITSPSGYNRIILTDLRYANRIRQIMGYDTPVLFIEHCADPANYFEITIGEPTDDFAMLERARSLLVAEMPHLLTGICYTGFLGVSRPGQMQMTEEYLQKIRDIVGHDVPLGINRRFPKSVGPAAQTDRHRPVPGGVQHTNPQNHLFTTGFGARRLGVDGVVVTGHVIGVGVCPIGVRIHQPHRIWWWPSRNSLGEIVAGHAGGHNSQIDAAFVPYANINYRIFHPIGHPDVWYVMRYKDSGGPVFVPTGEQGTSGTYWYQGVGLIGIIELGDWCPDTGDPLPWSLATNVHLISSEIGASPILRTGPL
ncbi:hypothetical protein M1O56_04080 [Dehalococcoidia bacterium]|nr:hypothetical protein [Dehalococcoidia bacterium]